MGRIRHSWDVSPKEAIELQKALREKVSVGLMPKERFSGIRTIAGADVSLERFGDELFAGIIVLSYPDLQPLCHAVVRLKVRFPYVPGLLSFREIPGLIECFERLSVKPDIVMVDGQGIAHPRRLGIAAHFGLAADVPTIGVAKSKLYGEYAAPAGAGAAEPITDPRTGEHIGYAFKSKERSNPLLISPGNGISVDQALDMVKSCLRGYRLPEPNRLAHELVNRFRRGEIAE